MEYLGTKFCITLGGMRLRFAVALEDTDEPSMPSERSRSAAGEPAVASSPAVHVVYRN